MATLNDNIRNEAQRGVILLILVHRKLEWVPFSELKQQMARGQGYLLTDEDLRFHLAYLSNPSRGYVEVTTLRPGRQDLAQTLARATTKAVDLLESRLPPDPGVAV
jgi:hypothetical protein